MLHNKIDKNHLEIKQNQHDLMKITTDNGKLQMTDNMQTMKLTKEIGEVSKTGRPGKQFHHLGMTKALYQNQPRDQNRNQEQTPVSKTPDMIAISSDDDE